jgi:hypothetical protein
VLAALLVAVPVLTLGATIGLPYYFFAKEIHRALTARPGPAPSSPDPLPVRLTSETRSERTALLDGPGSSMQPIVRPWMR